MTAHESRLLKGYGLVADVGGTNVRFGVVDFSGGGGPRINAPQVMESVGLAGIIAAARAYLAGVKVHEPPAAAVFAAAGPVHDGEITLTNVGTRLTERELMRQLGARRARLINDFEAIALAAPHFASGDLMPIGALSEFSFGREETGTIAIVGPGTGLGVAGVVRRGGQTIPLVTEGGHISWAPADDIEMKILGILRQRFGHVSAERLLSGPGLRNLYDALCESAGVAAQDLTPEQITQEAQRDRKSLCAATFARFCAILGSFAGDIALAMGAQSGVLIAGGIMPSVPDLLAASAFRERFEAKGRLKDYLKHVPTFLIVHGYPALVGAASLLKDVASGR